jgi:hypothetical protein
MVSFMVSFRVAVPPLSKRQESSGAESIHEKSMLLLAVVDFGL